VDSLSTQDSKVLSIIGSDNPTISGETYGIDTLDDDSIDAASQYISCEIDDDSQECVGGCDLPSTSSGFCDSRASSSGRSNKKGIFNYLRTRDYK